MKFVFAVVALLLIVALAEVHGSSRCPYNCKRQQRSNCHYYSYWSGDRLNYYYYCRNHRSYMATCYSDCVHGGWSDYSEWELVDDCPVYCGGAIARHVSTRSCNDPAPEGRGNACAGDAIRYTNMTCNPEACGRNCPADRDTYFAHPHDKKAFYHCSAGGTHAHLKTCQDQNTVWEQRSLACVHISYKTPSCDAGEMTPDPKDCGKFYHCSGGVMHRMSCAGGLHFDASANVCNWPSAANCIIDEL